MRAFRFILSACVAVVAFASCNNEDGVPQMEDTRMKSVEISLENAVFAATRGPAGSKITAGQAVVVNDFQIFLTDNAGNEYSAKVSDGSEDAQSYWTGADLAEGVNAQFHYVDNACTKVVAVANLGEKMTYAQFLEMENLKIGEEQESGSLSLYAEGTLTKKGTQHSDVNTDGTTYYSDVYEAALTLRPRISRFEVDGFSVKFNENPIYEEIQITDLLFQHYAAETSLATGEETQTNVDHISDLNNQTATYNWFNDTSKPTGWYLDTFTTPLVIKATDAVNNVSVADTPTPLAYHFFAGDVVPTFVIKLIADGQPAYIYSKGLYSTEKSADNQPVAITEFEEGKIYRMSAAGEVSGDGSIPIDEEDIDPMDRCLEITVDVVDWVVELVYPEF